MPDGLLEVIGLLTLGYVLLLIEIVVPGGILGVLGFLSIAYGVYLSFGLSTAWGVASVVLSILVTTGLVIGFMRSRPARRLMEDRGGGETWKAAQTGLEELLGREGVTLSPLRPAGLARIGDERVDVVSDSEFLGNGVAVRVVEVEGNRVVVEAVPETTAAADAVPDGSEADTPSDQ